jgi:hypothetical protein
MFKVGDLMASLGKYRDRQTQEEKTRWMKCGALLKRDDGSQVVKLDAIPTEFSGWLSVFEDKPKPPAPPPQQPETYPASKPGPTPNDEIPF